MWPSLPQPQTPHLEEDLKEVLRSEAGIELIIEDEVRPEKQKRKAGVSWGGGEGTGRSRGAMSDAAREWVWGKMVPVRHQGKAERPQALVSGTLPSSLKHPLTLQHCIPVKGAGAGAG